MSEFGPGEHTEKLALGGIEQALSPGDPSNITVSTRPGQDQLAEIDRATANLITAIENGTDPSLINPRLNQLSNEREILAGSLRTEPTPNRLTPADIDTLTAALGGIGQLLDEATPPEKVAVYQGLGLHLVYQPDQKALVATADLGRVFSRVGGPTPSLKTRPIPRSEVLPLSGLDAIRQRLDRMAERPLPPPCGGLSR